MRPWGKALQRQSAQYGAVPLVQSPSALQLHPAGKQGSWGSSLASASALAKQYFLVMQSWPGFLFSDVVRFQSSNFLA